MSEPQRYTINQKWLSYPCFSIWELIIFDCGLIATQPQIQSKKSMLLWIRYQLRVNWIYVYSPFKKILNVQLWRPFLPKYNFVQNSWLIAGIFYWRGGGEAVIFYCLENCKEIEGREHNGEGSTMEEGV